MAAANARNHIAPGKARGNKMVTIKQAYKRDKYTDTRDKRTHFQSKHGQSAIHYDFFWVYAEAFLFFLVF
jgi:hypothetical protein